MSAVVPTENEASNQLVLGDLLNLWGLALLLSVIAGAGLVPALRGARAGLDAVIYYADRVAGTASQFAAIATWLLVVHLSMLCLRLVKPRLVSLLVVLAAALPVVALMSAQRVRIGEPPLVFALGATTAAVLGSAVQIGGRHPGIRRAVLLSGLSLACRTVLSLPALGEFPSLREGPWSHALAEASLLLAIGCTLQVTWLKAQSSRIGTLAVPVVLFFALLSTQTLTASSRPDAPFQAVVAGRTLRALIGDASSPFLQGSAGYFMSLALALLFWTLVSRLRGRLRDHAALLSAAALCICIQLGPSPLSLAAITLSALSLMALSRHVYDGPEAA